MRHLWTFLPFVAVAVAVCCSSCVSPAPPPPIPVHSIQTITTICSGQLCAICADESRTPND